MNGNGGGCMAKVSNIKHNIFERPYVATLRRNGVDIEMVMWATDVKALKEKLREELSEKIELVSVRER